MNRADVEALTAALKAEAARLGFDAVGIAPAVPAPDYPQFRRWLDQGHAAGMAYLERRAEARRHPESLLPAVRSVVMVALSYNQPEPLREGTAIGKVARYARGRDYHEVFWRRLESLLGWVQAQAEGVTGRAVADTAPLLERDYARLAGLGWIGKNTMLIGRALGSYTLLGALLLDCELEYDPPHQADHCGTCTRCLDACPTGAFVGPGQLDARRCLSYWTIEHRGAIPDAIASSLDGWVFGCDICQEVCPWNRKARPGREEALLPGPEWRHPDLIAWLETDEAAFRARMRGTAMSRAKRGGLLRNAALILGERRVLDAEPALIDRLGDVDPILRGAAAWALGRLATPKAHEALQKARNDEDPEVRDAILQALDFVASTTSLSAGSPGSRGSSPASAGDSPPDPASSTESAP